MLTLSSIILVAVMLGLCAVFAVEIAKRRKKQRCPLCYSADVFEWRGENVCGACGERWHSE
jgi:hypothetical protein